MPRGARLAVLVAPLFGVLAAAQAKTWTIPEGASVETNPVASAPESISKGESLYKSNCAGCHGPKGLGDGPNVDRSDRRNRPANLTLSRTPEGVVFYKIWNGRKSPKMPAFSEELNKEQVWTIVTYVQTFRGK